MISLKRCLVAALLFTPLATFAADKPNFLMLWGDDIGYWNVSAYNCRP